MKRFIEQEAREKAEEIQIKVRWGSNGGHLLEPPTILVVLFPGSPSHVGEIQVITHYKFVHVVSSNLRAKNGGAHLHGGSLYMPFHAVWQLQVAI